MFISRTPLRVSLLGGGTDFPSYYNEHGGLCLSTTIDQYVYVIVKRRHDDSIRVSYTQTEIVDNVDALQHDLIREALRLTGVVSGVEIVTMADVPGHGSGLASSSAVTVGTLNALAEYAALWTGWERGRIQFELSQLAIQIECDILAQTPGRQDQIAITYGGLNLLKFERDETTVRSLLYDFGYPPGRWQRNLLLFAVAGEGERDSRQILADQDGRRGDNVEALAEMKGLLDKALLCLGQRTFDELGPILHEAWQLKQGLSPHIATPIIDEMYAAGRQAGASGGKICGAGGGGHMLFYCPAGTHDAVRAAMAPYGRELKFMFEWEGSVCKRLF